MHVNSALVLRGVTSSNEVKLMEACIDQTQEVSHRQWNIFPREAERKICKLESFKEAEGALKVNDPQASH